MIVQAIRESKKILITEFNNTCNHYLSVIKALKFKGQNGLKLNLGSGNIKKTNWINIDLYSPNADLKLDLRKRFPFEDNSCSEVYSEHFLEHLEYPGEASRFLSEVYRVLNHNGQVTICVPDTEWPIRSYIRGTKSDYFVTWHQKIHKTIIEVINHHFRQDGDHKYAYDFQLLEMFLNKHRFVNIKKRKFNSKIDSRSHHPGTLYVVANKK